MYFISMPRGIVQLPMTRSYLHGFRFANGHPKRVLVFRFLVRLRAADEVMELALEDVVPDMLVRLDFAILELRLGPSESLMGRPPSAPSLGGVVLGLCSRKSGTMSRGPEGELESRARM